MSSILLTGAGSSGPGSLPGTFAISAAPASIAGGDTFSFNVDRNNGTAGTVSVEVHFSGTAVDATDWTSPGTQTVSFSDGQASSEVDLSSLVHVGAGNKTVIGTLTNATGGAHIGSTSVATVTIAMPARLFTVAVTASVNGGTDATITISSQGNTGNASVTLHAALGTATADDVAVNDVDTNVYTWANGNNTDHTVALSTQANPGGGGTVLLSLDTPVGGAVGSPGTATLTINQAAILTTTSDAANPLPNQSVCNLTVTLSGMSVPFADDVTFTLNSPQSGLGDDQASTQDLTITAGNSTVGTTFKNVTVGNDSTVSLTITNPAAGGAESVDAGNPLGIPCDGLTAVSISINPSSGLHPVIGTATITVTVCGPLAGATPMGGFVSLSFTGSGSINGGDPNIGFGGNETTATGTYVAGAGDALTTVTITLDSANFSPIAVIIGSPGQCTVGVLAS